METLYENRIIVFLDILGFSEAVLNNSLNPATLKKTFEKIYSLVGRVNKIEGRKIQAYNVSDSFILIGNVTRPSCFLFPEQLAPLEPLVNLTDNFLLHIHRDFGLTVRGYMTIGDVYADTEKNILFGPGLIEALKVEKEVVKYPRVILSEQLAKHFDLDENLSEEVPIRRDSTDNHYFFDFLSRWHQRKNADYKNRINQYQNAIETLQKASLNNEKLQEKSKWCQSYFSASERSSKSLL